MQMSSSRTATIVWFGLVLFCCTTTATDAPATAAPAGSNAPATTSPASPAGNKAPATASPANSKAANARGMALMAKKKWAEAEVEFKRAVAEDPASVKAHYNLASAASRAHDSDTALWELAWVSDRAAWDAEAKAAAEKVEKDDDLSWLFDSINGAGIDGMKWASAMDLVQPDDTAHLGHALPDAERAKMGALLEAMSGPHDTKCDSTDAKQGKVLSLALRWGKLAKHTAVGSLKDGVALVDPKGVVAARSEPLGCTGPGESQDQLATLVFASGDPAGLATPQHLVPTSDLELLAVSFTTGGRREWQTTVAVFARRNNAFVKVFEAPVASSETNGAGHLWQSALGNLVYMPPGEKKKHAFRWDPAGYKFVPMP